MNTRSRAIFLAAALAGAAATVPAAVRDTGGSDFVQVRSEIVDYEAAEVRDAKSAERLFFRIRRAAEEVCRLSSHPVGYELWEERACEAEAVSEAVDATGLPALEEYYFDGRQRGGSAAALAE
jgi:UrcA family protein